MSLTIQVQEPTEEWIKEAGGLFVEHYEEISSYKDIPLNPDYEKYAAHAAAGKLLVLSARYDGELVGYVIYIIDTALHYQSSLQAHQDILFVKKGMRKSVMGCGLMLLRQSEKVLKEMGVQVIYQHVKIKHDFSPFLEKLGYDCVEKIYQKRID